MLKSAGKLLRKLPEYLNDEERARDDTLEAAITSDHEVILDFLIKYRINVDLTTLLKVTLQRSQGVKCAKLLLKRGASLDGPEWRSESPAEIVFKRNDPEFRLDLMLLLVGYGLDRGFRNRQGESLLHVLVRHVACKHEPYRDAVEMASIILDAGVPLDEADRIGWTPLLRSVCSPRFDLARFLITKGADVNRGSLDKSMFPLLSAARYANVDLVELLVSKGADVNARNSQGDTALHAACIFNRDDTIAFLVKNGADISAKNIHGSSPFFLAFEKFYKEFKPLAAGIVAMVKEFAKFEFFGDRCVSVQDIKLVRDNKKILDCFEECLGELKAMTSVKFYARYYYIDVIKMSDNEIKLTCIAKDNNVTKNFTKNLEFSYYGADFVQFLDETLSGSNDLLNSLV